MNRTENGDKRDHSLGVIYEKDWWFQSIEESLSLLYSLSEQDEKTDINKFELQGAYCFGLKHFSL